MVPKKILFVLSSSLGWRTYQHQIISVVEGRDDIDADFYICRPTVPERVLMYNLPCDPIRRPVDPMFVWGWRLGRWWRQTGRTSGYDAIHVATQDNALAFAELVSCPPLSLAIDITRRAYTQIHSSRKALEAEVRIFRKAGFIAPMSEWAARPLVKYYGLDPTRILVTPPSVPITPLDRFRLTSNRASPLPHPATQRQYPMGGRVGERAGAVNIENGLGAEPVGGATGLVNIAFVGNDFERKGGPELLRLHQERFRDRARLHILSRRFAGAERYVNVISHGQIPYDALIDEFLPSMDLFCLPTNYDMSPWVCVHASVAGLPTVVNLVGGVAELCLDGETGFVLPPGDRDALARRLSELIDNAELRRTMGRRAHDFAATHLDAQKNYNRLLDRTLDEC